jgi:opacity protein-like surface antigen
MHGSRGDVAAERCPRGSRSPKFLHRRSSMKLRLITVLAAAALAIAAVAAVTASAATARHVEGRVASIDRDARSFSLRDSERGTFRVFVASSTRFERTSFARLRAGSRIEATIRRTDGRWVASHVETSGGGGNHGGGNDSGRDDNGGHGADG